MKTTYDVRIFSILTNNLADKKKSHTVRWKVGDNPTPFRKTYTAKAAAESFRSKLLVAHREGIAFDTESGLPITMTRKNDDRLWFDHAKSYVDMKWPHVSAKHRQSIADGLSVITMALLRSDDAMPPKEDLRDVMYGWAYNKTRREAGLPPKHLQRALRWLEANTVPVTSLGEDLALVRRALDALTVRDNGQAVAASSVARKRAVFSGALKYAVELGTLDSHPFARITWKAPKNDDELDMRTVVNHGQARDLLEAVKSDSPDFEAFFACMYYAALRPQEALHLRDADYERPKTKGERGWFLLTGATVATAQGWNDADTAVADGPLKHRAANATRRVPVPPQLVEILDRHIDAWGFGPDGRFFVTRRIGKGKYTAIGRQPFSRATYSRVWAKAREKALTVIQVKSPLAKVPYHLRHAAVSTWLSAGVSPTQVAKWAGHSVQVLMRVYAKCLDNQEETACRLVEKALSDADTKTPTQVQNGQTSPTRKRHSE